MKTMIQKFSLPLAIILFIGLSSFSIFSWELLGSKKVDYGLDKDVIHVTAKEGRFTKLKLVVTGAPINMHRMEVVYGNGDRDAIPLKHNFTKRSDSRVIDLEGNKRVINKIIFFYDTKNKARRKATLKVFGKR